MLTECGGAGENWRYTMNDLKISPPYCTPGGEGKTDCGFALGSTMFFITFLLLQTYLLTNLFVAAILEYVASGLLRERLFLTPQHLDKFQVQTRMNLYCHLLQCQLPACS